MKDTQHRMSKTVRVCIGIVVLCCVSLAFYTFATDIEWRVCRERMATELGVPSNGAAITNAWYNKLTSLFPPGTIREDVISSLTQITPLETHDIGKLLDDSRMELTIIKPCLFPVNSLRFLFYYSEDNTLIDIRIDPSD